MCWCILGPCTHSSVYTHPEMISSTPIGLNPTSPRWGSSKFTLLARLPLSFRLASPHCPPYTSDSTCSKSSSWSCSRPPNLLLLSSGNGTNTYPESKTLTSSSSPFPLTRHISSTAHRVGLSSKMYPEPHRSPPPAVKTLARVPPQRLRTGAASSPVPRPLPKLHTC